MLFWSLMIAFGVVWAIAVAIEVIWFWGPPKEEAVNAGLGPGESKPTEKPESSQEGGSFEGELETRAS